MVKLVDTLDSKSGSFGSGGSSPPTGTKSFYLIDFLKKPLVSIATSYTKTCKKLLNTYLVHVASSD